MLVLICQSTPHTSNKKDNPPGLRQQEDVQSPAVECGQREITKTETAAVGRHVRTSMALFVGSQDSVINTSTQEPLSSIL